MSQRQLDKFDKENERSFDAFIALNKGLKARDIPISEIVTKTIPSKLTDFPLRKMILNNPDDEKHP